jgi:hypothetical protein
LISDRTPGDIEKITAKLKEFYGAGVVRDREKGEEIEESGVPKRHKRRADELEQSESNEELGEPMDNIERFYIWKPVSSVLKQWQAGKVSPRHDRQTLDTITKELSAELGIAVKRSYVLDCHDAAKNSEEFDPFQTMCMKSLVNEAKIQRRMLPPVRKRLNFTNISASNCTGLRIVATS